MKIIKTVEEMKQQRRQWFKEGHSLGFVPTMGFLHDGHLSLVDRSKEENDVTVVSIFVNPTQFGPGEDFDSYPRDLERDCALLKDRGVDAVFFPQREALYPGGYATYVNVEKLDNVLCGKSRPGHFRGVCTVVLKLFNIVGAQRAYFGRKDAQQAIILKKMAIDLDLDTEVRTLPIVRDPDGLAMSSRNTYLSSEERERALAFPQALQQARADIENGETHVATIKENIIDRLSAQPGVTVDYVEVVSLDSLEPLETVAPSNTLVAGAVKVGKTRLINNFILGEI